MAQMMRLVSFGPVLIMSDLPVSILCKLHLYVDLVYIKNTKKFKKNSPMAQTMPDALFGPVLLISVQHVMYLVN